MSLQRRPSSAGPSLGSAPHLHRRSSLLRGSSVVAEEVRPPAGSSSTSAGALPLTSSSSANDMGPKSSSPTHHRSSRQDKVTAQLAHFEDALLREANRSTSGAASMPSWNEKLYRCNLEEEPQLLEMLMTRTLRRRSLRGQYPPEASEYSRFAQEPEIQQHRSLLYAFRMEDILPPDEEALLDSKEQVRLILSSYDNQRAVKHSAEEPVQRWVEEAPAWSQDVEAAAVARETQLELEGMEEVQSAQTVDAATDRMEAAVDNLKSFAHHMFESLNEKEARQHEALRLQSLRRQDVKNASTSTTCVVINRIFPTSQADRNRLAVAAPHHFVPPGSIVLQEDAFLPKVEKEEVAEPGSVEADLRAQIRQLKGDLDQSRFVANRLVKEVEAVLSRMGDRAEHYAQETKKLQEVITQNRRDVQRAVEGALGVTLPWAPEGDGQTAAEFVQTNLPELLQSLRSGMHKEMELQLQNRARHDVQHEVQEIRAQIRVAQEATKEAERHTELELQRHEQTKQLWEAKFQNVVAKHAQLEQQLALSRKEHQDTAARVSHVQQQAERLQLAKDAMEQRAVVAETQLLSSARESAERVLQAQQAVGRQVARATKDADAEVTRLVAELEQTTNRLHSTEEQLQSLKQSSACTIASLQHDVTAAKEGSAERKLLETVLDQIILGHAVKHMLQWIKTVRESLTVATHRPAASTALGASTSSGSSPASSVVALGHCKDFLKDIRDLVDRALSTICGASSSGKRKETEVLLETIQQQLKAELAVDLPRSVETAQKAWDHQEAASNQFLKEIAALKQEVLSEIQKREAESAKADHVVHALEWWGEYASDLSDSVFADRDERAAKWSRRATVMAPPWNVLDGNKCQHALQALTRHLQALKARLEARPPSAPVIPSAPVDSTQLPDRQQNEQLPNESQDQITSFRAAGLNTTSSSGPAPRSSALVSVLVPASHHVVEESHHHSEEGGGLCPFPNMTPRIGRRRESSSAASASCTTLGTNDEDTSTFLFPSSMLAGGGGGAPPRATVATATRGTCTKLIVTASTATSMPPMPPPIQRTDATTMTTAVAEVTPLPPPHSAKITMEERGCSPIDGKSRPIVLERSSVRMQTEPPQEAPPPPPPPPQMVSSSCQSDVPVTAPLVTIGTQCDATETVDSDHAESAPPLTTVPAESARRGAEEQPVLSTPPPPPSQQTSTLTTTEQSTQCDLQPPSLVPQGALVSVAPDLSIPTGLTGASNATPGDESRTFVAAAATAAHVLPLTDDSLLSSQLVVPPPVPQTGVPPRRHPHHQQHLAMALHHSDLEAARQVMLRVPSGGPTEVLKHRRAATKVGGGGGGGAVRTGGSPTRGLLYGSSKGQQPQQHGEGSTDMSLGAKPSPTSSSAFLALSGHRAVSSPSTTTAASATHVGASSSSSKSPTVPDDGVTSSQPPDPRSTVTLSSSAGGNRPLRRPNSALPTTTTSSSSSLSHHNNSNSNSTSTLVITSLSRSIHSHHSHNHSAGGGAVGVAISHEGGHLNRAVRPRSACR